jgi:hypothetical protein
MPTEIEILEDQRKEAHAKLINMNQQHHQLTKAVHLQEKLVQQLDQEIKELEENG